MMETLVAGEHAKLVDYARFRVSDMSKLVLSLFVLDINRALPSLTEEFIDDLQALVKPKRHDRLSKFLFRNISTAVARFRVFTVGDFTRCAVAGRLHSDVKIIAVTDHSGTCSKADRF